MLNTSYPGVLRPQFAGADPGAGTTDAGMVSPVSDDPDPEYMKCSSRASLSSCACCLRRATWAAMTRCLSAIRVHLAHTQSLHRQKRLWPFSADTTPWLRQRAHFGVRGYPRSRAGLQAAALRKSGGVRSKDAGTCRPPTVRGDVVCGDKPSALLLVPSMSDVRRLGCCSLRTNPQ